MSVMQLNVDFMFAHADLPKGMNFNEVFSKMLPMFIPYASSLVHAQTGIENMISHKSLNDFKTTHEKKQSFLLTVDCERTSFLDLRILCTLRDSEGKNHVLLDKTAASSNVPQWFLGFSSPVTIEPECVRQRPLHQNTVIHSTLANPATLHMVEVTEEKQEPDKLPSKEVQSIDKEDVELWEETLDLLDCLNVSIDAVAKTIGISKEVIYSLQKRIVFPNWKSCLDKLNEGLHEIERLQKEGRFAVSGTGKELPVVIPATPEVMKKTPEQARRDGFISQINSYLSMIGKSASFYGSGIGPLTLQSIRSGTFGAFTENQLLEILTKLRSYHAEIRVKEDKREQSNAKGFALIKELQDIVKQYPGKSQRQIGNILGISQTYVSMALRSSIGNMSEKGIQKVLDIAKDNIRKQKKEEAAKALKEAKEKQAKEAKAKEKEQTPAADVLTPHQKLEKLSAMFIGAKKGNAELAKMYGTDEDHVDRIIRRNFSQFEPDYIDNLYQYSLLINEERKANPEKKPDVLKDLSDLGSLNGLVKVASHPSGVLIPKFDSSFNAKADEEIRTTYGKNPRTASSRITNKFFQANRNDLRVISNNSIQISEYTGIPSTMVNRSMKFGSMIPARDILAIRIYLDSIATVIEEIKKHTSK